MTAYSIACLAGDGIGPEVMAQASRGMRAAARMHGFTLDEGHVPFGADATMRVGHPFPLAIRNAALAADAILAATVDQDLLQTLEGELDLRAAVMRVRLRTPRSRSSRRSGPTRGNGRSSERSPRRASSRGHLTFVGERRTAGRPTSRRPAATTASVSRTSPLAAPSARSRRARRSSTSSSAPSRCSSPLAELAWCLDSRRVLAWGRLAADGPGIFGPSHGTAADIAGQGVADPSSMLLAAALMLGEASASGARRQRSPRPSRYVRGTRHAARAVGTVSMSSELTDAVLARLPQSHSNAEFLTEAV